jgi:hypothetical protein
MVVAEPANCSQRSFKSQEGDKMIAKTSAIDPVIRAFCAVNSLRNRLALEFQAMTFRSTAVAGGMVGAIIPLAQFSYDEPLKGLILAAMLPTPTVRRLICSAAGVKAR